MKDFEARAEAEMDRGARLFRRDELLSADPAPRVRALLGVGVYDAVPELLLVDALAAVAAAQDRVDLRLVQVMCQHALEELEGAAPAPSLERPETDARWWAALASPRELEAYLREIVKHLGEGPVTARARKRLMIALWGQLSPEDRRAFVAKVTEGT